MRVALRSTVPTILWLLVLVAGCAVADIDEPDDGTAADADQTDELDDSDAGGDVADGTPDGPSGDVDEPVLSVMATVAPVSDLVRTVGGGRVQVASLVPAGADSHTYEPRPQDVARLADAQAYFGIGLDLNHGAVRLAEENLPDGAPLVLLGEVALTDDEIVFDHRHDDEGGGHSHDDEGGGHGHDGEGGGHSHDDEGGGHSHDEGELGPNAHVWTSLRNSAALVQAIADTLSDLDPEGEDTYRENAAAAQEAFGDLDRSIADAAATIPADNRTLVTYHDAWTYFARDYRLEFATAVQPADFSEPSAAEVRAIIDLILEREVPAVFGSEVFPTPVLETIAEETGATYFGDLADDMLPGEPGDEEHNYLELMRRNAVTIISGLGGDVSQLEG